MAASIMAVCIITIHKITSHFGRVLPLSSLVLCGISAMCINFLVISVTPFLTKAYYYILGTMIVFAATGTTCYNKYLLNKKARLATVAMPQTATIASSLDNALEHHKATAPMEEELAPQPEPVLEESILDISPIASDSSYLPVEITTDESTAEPEIDIRIPEPAITTEAHDAPVIESASEPMVPNEAPEPEVEPLQQLETLETLDDILDFAFAQASSQPQVAIQAYKFALERYRTDEYAPFIVIDMVNLYQAQEQYLEAMDCIGQAMELPAIQDNPATRQNFQSYLSQIQALYNSKEPR